MTKVAQASCTTFISLSVFISEDLVKQMADHMVSAGYKDAGYEYVSIDVSKFYCWTNWS